MTKVKVLLALAAFAFTGVVANAQAVQSRLFACSVTYKLAGEGAQFIVGDITLSGPGMVKCRDIQGNTEEYSVNVTLGSSDPGVKVGIGKFKTAAFLLLNGYLASPSDVVGTYYANSAVASVGIGTGYAGAYRADSGNVTLSPQWAVSKGLGINVAFVDRLEISNLVLVTKY